MSGDLLVQQVRSAIGATSEQRSSLRSLGLARIGRSSVVQSDKASVRGQLHEVRHLVAVKPLTVTAGERLFSCDRGGAMRAIPYVPYEVEGREARRYQLEDGGFLVVELYDGAFSLTWSTELPIASILRRVGGMLPPTRSETMAVVYDPGAHRQIELHAEPLLRDLRCIDRGYPFVSVEFVGLTVAWRCPEYPKHIDHDVVPGEIGIVSRSFDEGYFVELVRATATPELGWHADEIIESTRYVAAYVHGRSPRNPA